MRLKIDIERSIKRRKLIPTSRYLRIHDYFTYSLYAVVIIICIVGPTIGVKIEINSIKIVLISLALVLLFIVIRALNKMDYLTVIENSKSKLDRNFFISLAKKSEWSLINESDNLLFFNANHWFFHQRQVTIIIENNFIFINVMSFGKYDIKSPLYRRKDKEILSQILEKIKKNAT